MPLTQAEADALLQMPKEFLDATPLEFPNSQALNYVRELRSVDRRELFLFDFERGNRNRARLKYQTRGRKVFILARLDINGPAHRNPPNAPYPNLADSTPARRIFNVQGIDLQGRP